MKKHTKAYNPIPENPHFSFRVLATYPSHQKEGETIRVCQVTATGLDKLQFRALDNQSYMDLLDMIKFGTY